MDEKQKIESHIRHLTWLVHYHERVMMSKPSCTADCKNHAQIGECPTVVFADGYREALEYSISLLRERMEQLG